MSHRSSSRRQASNDEAWTRALMQPIATRDAAIVLALLLVFGAGVALLFHGLS
jgi:hypothetical protein